MEKENADIKTIGGENKGTNEKNLNKNQNDKIKFNKDLANREWINERDSIRYRVFGNSCIGVNRILPILNTDINPFFILHNHNESYFIYQNKFEKSLPLGNRIFSIDTCFANNMKYNQMFKQKYFVDVTNPREIFYGIETVNIIATNYMQSHIMKEESLYSNQEINEYAKNPVVDIGRFKDTRQGLDSKNITIEDRKKFNNITNNFFDLPNTHMKSVVEFLIKHKSYSYTFFMQGIMHQLSLNLNVDESGVEQYAKDIGRNEFGVQADDYNSRKQETLSYDSRHMILCFFRPEYLFSDEKPNPELIEFYVALNSLLSVTEKENAKAILNSDDKKLTEQQKELKKKLSGEDKKFRNNIINEWKNGFFLDKNKIKDSDKLFTEKEKKFEDAFYKNRVMDLVIEIENGNLNLIPQGQENNINADLSSKNNNDDKVNFLVEQLFGGARIADKDNKTYLKLLNLDRDPYVNKDLSEKLKPIANNHKLRPKTAFVYDENKGLIKVIDWLISEIENGNLKLMSQEQNKDPKNDLSSANNNDEKVKFLVSQLFNGASVVDKDKNDIIYLKFGLEEIGKYSGSGLEEQLKLIDKKIQFCPKAAKILKASDFDLSGYRYRYLKKERLSELLYFQDDEQKHDYIYLKENKNYYRDYILHKDYGENELYNKLYQCTQKADFGKYKREHFIFDETGKIIGMDVLAYFADKIVSGELKLTDNKGKDISDEVKNIDNDLAREVFLMDQLKNNGYFVCDRENNKFTLNMEDMSNRMQIIDELTSEIKNLVEIENGIAEVKENVVNSLFYNLYLDDNKNKTIKDFIKMFRLEKKDIKEIVTNTQLQSHALIHRYALNKIFTEKIKPVNQKGQKLIDKYVFDFSGTNCEQDDLVFAKDGRVEYVKYESLPKVLKLGDIETNELKARNRFIGLYGKKEKYKSDTADIEIDLQNMKIDSKLLNNLKEKYEVGKENSDEAKTELESLRVNLDSNACTNLNDFYDPDSYRDELLDVYIKFYQNADIDYEYWDTECAKKFLKDKKERGASKVEIVTVELKFFKGQKIEFEDLSRFTRNKVLQPNTRVTLYQDIGVPYKLWDPDAKNYYFDELQWKWFKIGCIPLVVLILSIISFFIPVIEGYLVIKIIFTSGSFVCGCLVAGKGRKNKKDRDYRGKDTYDNPGYSYPNDNVIGHDLNVMAQKQNMGSDTLQTNLNTGSITNTDANININAISTSSSSSISSEQSHESDLKTTDLQRNTDPNFLKINLQPGPLTIVNEIKQEGENNIPEFDPKNKTKNDLRDENKNIIEPGNP